jgi:hypothetical protein
MDPAWREHFEALKRFNEWEAEQLRNRVPDYGRTLAWLSDAWEFAARLGSPEDPEVRRERHLGEILALRAALTRADLKV